MALALGISRKCIYHKGIREGKDLAFKQVIENIHLTHPAYGHRRVALELNWSKNRALRIMRKYGIKPPRRKAKSRWLTKSVDTHHYTNLVKNIAVLRPEQVFVSDLTYIKYQNSTIYLATVEDIFTREILGVDISNQHDSTLALNTIRQAINVNRIPEVFHSDQGSEFMAGIVTSYLEGFGVKVSVSDTGSPWQNGYKESFFGRFKEENGDLNRFESLGELIEEIYSYINYHNNHRIHTALKMSPAEFKRRFQDADILSQKQGT